MALVRSVIFFLLGVAVILDAILQTPTHVTELICGLFLLGLVTVDDFFGRLPFVRRSSTPRGEVPSR